MKVLIVGAGIAGPTLAYWLLRAGYEPTLVEHAPRQRQGGYIIDFWGAGFDVAERMGIVPQMLRAGYRFGEVRQVDADGHRVARFTPEIFVRSSGGRYVSIARGDLAAILYAALEDRVETIFGDTVDALDDHGERVRVTFASGAEREFDLVVGADGLHSQVRRLAFGPEEEFETFLGIDVAAFDIEGYRPRDELVALLYTEVGFQVARMAVRDDVTMFLFTVRRGDGDAPGETVQSQQAWLRERLAGAGWETPAILERMKDAKTFYFDRVSQIRMPSWTRGRVALVGDAAACVSLLAGQGSALAMVEAYVLAAELGRARGDHAAAFTAYERTLAPMLRAKQKAAERLAIGFAPRNRLQLFVRNAVMKLMGLPTFAELTMGNSLRDAIELPAAPTG